MSSTYFSHPLVSPGLVELRENQTAIPKQALTQNTLVILPPGLGKTPTALMVMAERLTGSSKVLLVAPTKPLCEQHHKTFERFLPYTVVRLLTGELPAKERLKEWTDAQVIIATPQTIENDLKAQTYSLKDVSLLVIDEAHRAVGGYAYTYIASEYQTQSENPHILAMTASPGGDEDKVDAIKESLFIDKVISKSEDDPDVKPYLHEKEIVPLYLDLPDGLECISSIIIRAIQVRVKMLREMGTKISLSPSMRELNSIKTSANKLIAEHNGTGYQISAIHAEILKLKHAQMLAETQGIISLKKYIEQLISESQQAKPIKSSLRLVKDDFLTSAFCSILDAGTEEIHPKTKRLLTVVQYELNRNPGNKILIFASYRDMGEYLVNTLNEAGISASAFVGQAKKGSQKGMSQKKQVEVINRFKAGEFQVLVSTCIGEEGLDIPATDMVIFYEPVPSEVRSIQRRGRTGRFADGKVIVLITRNTIDQLNYTISQRKEQAMKTMDHSTKQAKIGA